MDGSGEDLRLPGNMMTHVFQYHFSEDSLIAIMTNSPGELTGKFSSHESIFFCYFLMYFNVHGVWP
jgi:hypothetical protein